MLFVCMIAFVITLRILFIKRILNKIDRLGDYSEGSWENRNS